ncbi:MAG: PorP/SprF family type IX secretion system membrane protein [Saprospiraceae bacterium]|nr:PorP/SprF family type IX secretion system membrane protein [Saprospiraceae bacterium]
MKQSFIFFFVLFIQFPDLSAQDAHFSQFYSAPLLLNPAIAGTYTGTFRISSIYRDQWRSAVDQPLSTFSVSGDVKFEIDYSKKNLPDLFAVGITFFADRVSVFDFNTNQILLTAAYHKALDKKTKQYIGIGFQGGIAQRSVNYENLTFQDQFNAIDGYTLGTGEFLPPNNIAFADFNLGLYYTIAPSKKFNFHIGAGLFHFQKPNISFYNDQDIIDPNIVKVNSLGQKWSFHTGASIQTSEFISVQPRILFLAQDPHSELNLGLNFRFKISKTSGKYLHLGPWLRGVKNRDNYGLESFIAMAGIEMNNFIFGFSYDQSLGSLVRDRRSLSSFEFSVTYIGEHHNNDNFCPQF